METQTVESIEILKLKELAISSAHDGIALLDAEGKYYYLNEAHVKPFGYDHEQELIGKTWHAIYPPEEIERLERDMFPLLVEHGKWTGETCGITKQGTPVYQEISLTFSKDGGIICITRFLNKEKEIERELLQRSRKMASMIENITDGILLEDENRLIRGANPALLRLFDLPGDASDLTGVNCSEAINGVAQCTADPESFVARVNELIENLEAGNDIIPLLSGRILKRDFVPIKNKGETEGFLWIYHDITSLEESKRKLEGLIAQEREVNEVKSKLIHTISHEFKQPINSAIESLDILRAMTQNNDDSYSRPWEYLSMELQKLNRNVERIVNFESLYHSKSCNMAPVGAKNLVSNFLNYNYKMFVMTGKFELEESLLNEEIGVDLALFDLALRNLVDNAIKYSNPNDAIRIKCSAFSDTVSFIFENNTKNGIEAENNRLGTPFYRGLNNEPGLGLGLSIVDNCVQLMGGKAMFGSENEQFISIITFPVLKQ